MDPKDEIKQKIDIVELLGEYLTLKPSGTQGFKAVCPFHSENTPSFHISADRQVWHCFGCGEGGDCFSFVMKMEGMDFSEALMHLGQKVGVEVRRLTSTQSNVKQRLLELHDLAVRYYKKNLAESSEAAFAREYVKQRGISPDLVDRFGLGFAPDTWNALTQFLFTRHYTESDVLGAGLAQQKKSGSGCIDRFRNRLMIPLRDQHGNTIGFTARILPNPKVPVLNSSPKYMNSPETPVYHKGSLLFGLDLAKRAIKEQKQVIIVEGNLDVIASHKAGVEHVVASSGTALTETQLRLLGRYTKTIVFAFDQDAAGLMAAKRGISLSRGIGFDVRAIILPEGTKDPDDLVQQDPLVWKQLSMHSVPIMEFLIARVTHGKDLRDVDDKRLVSQELLPALAEIQDVVEQEHWTGIISGLLGIDTDRLRSSLGKMKSLTAPVSSVPAKAANFSSKKTKMYQVAQLILGLWINDPHTDGQVFAELSDRSFPDELQELYNKAQMSYHSAQIAPKQSFFFRLRDDLERESREDLVHLLDQISLLADKTFSQLSEMEVQEQLKSLIRLLMHEQAQMIRKQIAQQLRQAELAGDQEAVRTLLEQLGKLKIS